MTNRKCKDFSEFRDIEIKNAYRDFVGGGILDEETMLKFVNAIGRDNARFPMHWDDSDNAGFTTGTPWISVLSLIHISYYFTRAKNTFSRVFFALMAASMIIPFQAIMIPLVSIYGSGLHLLNHRLTLIFMHTGFALSMSVFIYQGFIKSGIPLSLEEAAYLDGCCLLYTSCIYCSGRS